MDEDTILEWRQGDCVVGSTHLVYRNSSTGQLTTGEPDIEYSELPVSGFVVVTQTCNVVRHHSERPYVQLAPLRSVASSTLKEVRSGRRPSLLYIPGVAEHDLVGDLDLVMTVEKTELVGWERTPGWENDEQERHIRRALGRNLSRAAFPDDFTRQAHDLRKRAVSKHGKQSPEGQALNSISEILVRAAPSWAAEEIELTFLFIAEDHVADSDWDALSDQVSRLAGRFEHGGRFSEPIIDLVRLEDISAREYRESDPLDLDFLSDSDAGVVTKP